MSINENKYVARGGVILPFNGEKPAMRDCYGETIAKHIGKQVSGRFYTHEEWIRQHDSYRYIIYYPGEIGLTNWTAFRTLASFQVFMAAYGIKVVGEIKPDDFFTLQLPQSVSKFQDLQMLDLSAPCAPKTELDSKIRENIEKFINLQLPKCEECESVTDCVPGM